MRGLLHCSGSLRTRRRTHAAAGPENAAVPATQRQQHLLLPCAPCVGAWAAPGLCAPFSRLAPPARRRSACHPAALILQDTTLTVDQAPARSRAFLRSRRRRGQLGMAQLASAAFEAPRCGGIGSLRPSDQSSACTTTATLLQDIVAGACDLAASGALSVSQLGRPGRPAPQPGRLLAGLMQTPAPHQQPLLLAPATLAGCFDADDDADTDDEEVCESSGVGAPWPAASWEAAACLSVRPSASSSGAGSARGLPSRSASRCLCRALAAAAATPAAQQAAAVASDSCSSCSSRDGATSGQLEQWLSRMAAQLQLPAAQAQRKRTLAPLHAINDADATVVAPRPANKRRDVTALQHWPAAPAPSTPDDTTCTSTSHTEPGLPRPAWALLGLPGGGIGGTH